MKVGWQAKPFEDCIKKATYTSKIQRKDFLSEGTYPVISQEEDFINGYWNNEADLFKVEAPVIIFGDHTKILKYVNFDFVLGADGVKILPPLDFLEPKFFFYQLQTANLESLGYARHYKLLKELKIVYPSRTEQQRIVAKLDQAFEGIAKARANAEQNLKNARALFESHLQSVFSVRPELIEGRHGSTSSPRTGDNNFVALSDLATDITDGDHMPPPKAIVGVPFITIGNIVKDTRTIDFTDTFKVPAEYFNKLKANKKPKLGDVLYTVTGSFGIPVLVKDNQEFCFQRHIGLIRPKPDVSSEWLCYLLSSPQLLKQANDGATGTAQKTVSLKVLRGFQVPNLPIDKQNEMVVELDALSKETQRLETIYQRKITLLDELKKSLLQQAFAGEL